MYLYFDKERVCCMPPRIFYRENEQPSRNLVVWPVPCVANMHPFTRYIWRIYPSFKHMRGKKIYSTFDRNLGRVAYTSIHLYGISTSIMQSEYSQRKSRRGETNVHRICPKSWSCGLNVHSQLRITQRNIEAENTHGSPMCGETCILGRYFDRIPSPRPI